MNKLNINIYELIVMCTMHLQMMQLLKTLTILGEDYTVTTPFPPLMHLKQTLNLKIKRHYALLTFNILTDNEMFSETISTRRSCVMFRIGYILKEV